MRTALLRKSVALSDSTWAKHDTVQSNFVYYTFLYLGRKAKKTFLQRIFTEPCVRKQYFTDGRFPHGRFALITAVFY